MNVLKNIVKMKEIKKRLKELLLWSDRIGSDERCEILELIKICENNILKNEKN